MTTPWIFCRSTCAMLSTCFVEKQCWLWFWSSFLADRLEVLVSFFATTVSSGRGVQQVTTGPLLFASALLKVIGNIGVHTLGAGLEVALQKNVVCGVFCKALLRSYARAMGGLFAVHCVKARPPSLYSVDIAISVGRNITRLDGMICDVIGYITHILH